MEKKKIYKYILGGISVSLISIGIIVMSSNAASIKKEMYMEIEEILDIKNDYKILDSKENKYLLTKEGSYWSNKKDRLYLYDEKSKMIKEIAMVENGAYAIHSGIIQDERIIFSAEIKRKKDGTQRTRKRKLGYGSAIFEIELDKELKSNQIIKDVGAYELEGDNLIFKDYEDENISVYLLNLEDGYKHKIFEDNIRILEVNTFEDTVICVDEENGDFTVLDIKDVTKDKNNVEVIFNGAEAGYLGVWKRYLYDGYIYMLEDIKSENLDKIDNLIRININTGEEEIILDGSKEYITDDATIEAVNGKLVVLSNTVGISEVNGVEKKKFSFRGYINLDTKEIVSLANKESHMELIGDKLLVNGINKRTFIELKEE